MGGRCGVVDQDIAVMVENLGVQHRLCIGAAVGDRCKCGSQLDVVYTVCNSAESHCLSDIGIR